MTPYRGYMTHVPSLWGLLDDRPGHANQVRGLVEAMGMPHRFITLEYTLRARLPNILLGRSILHLTPETKAALTAPWPDMVIACGRRTEPVARWIKRQNPATHIVYIMTPASIAGWDAVIIPVHDVPDTTDARIIPTHGPLHRITPALLGEAHSTWAATFAAYPAPRIGVLIGDVSPELAMDMVAQAQAFAGEGGSLLISTSRRTTPGIAAALAHRITQPFHLYDWHAGTGENPYLGILAHSDRLIVSGDSLSMCVEAVASGVPTHIAEPACLPAKHRAFHAKLFSDGHALTLDQSPQVTPTATNDTLTVAETLKTRLLQRGQATVQQA